MSSSLWRAADWLLCLAAPALLTLGPRALLAELGEATPPRWQRIAVFLVLIAVAIAAMLATPYADPVQCLIHGLVATGAAAAIYYDLRYLIVPDLVSGGIAAAALGAAALSGGWIAAAGGAALCGGLLAAVAWAFRRARGQEGLGFGDVKLAAAFGGLLGVEGGLWMISAGAISGASWGLVRRWRASDLEAPAMIPFGAFLAVVGAGLFLCRS